MGLQHPALLLLIVPFAWTLYQVGRRRLRRLPWLRAAVTLALRLLIGTLLVLALAGPRVVRAANGVQVVFVLDNSASISPADRQRAASWIQGALRAMHDDDSASLVVLGSQPLWLGTVGRNARLPVLPPVSTGGTDIAAAIQLALGAVATDRPSRIVLLSDGRQTQGDALLAAQRAAGAGIPVSVVALTGAATGDVAVASLELPSYSRSGERLTLRAGVQAGRATNAQVRILADGAQVDQQTLALHAGLNTFLLPQTAGQPGTHTYSLQLSASSDPVAQNNSRSAVTVVQPAPRVLVLTGVAHEADALIQQLRGAGAQVRAIPALQAPTSAEAMAAYDAVVLADVPASDLSPAATAALRDAVQQHGQGLLVTGGAHSFAAGGYPDSALEPMLPVTSVAVAHAGRGQVALYLIIDKSGSMMDEEHGISKISMAQEAAIEAIAHLRPNDQIGILAFDDTTREVVPFGIVGGNANVARDRQAIQGLQAFGNTVIYPAMRQAARNLFASPALFKHVVLMTDGQGENAPFLKLIGQMRQNNITLSTIAIGSDAEVDELRGFAAAGGGRYYFTADPHDIPRLVVLETRISSGPTRVEGTVAPHQSGNAPNLRSLAGTTLPTLHAYNITTPRDNGQILLQSTLGDPILAQWQFGLGRVAVWTGGTDADWARNWLNESAFWNDTLHWVLPAATPQDLRPALQMIGNTLHVGADAFTPRGGFANLLTTRAQVTDPDGHSRTVTLAQDAPGHYSAAIPASGPGIYQAQVAQYDGTATLRQAPVALAVPYSPEYDQVPPDLALLNSLAAADNAPSLRAPTAAFNSTGLQTHPVQRDAWPLLALLALLLFPVDIGVRILYTPPVPHNAILP